MSTTNHIGIGEQWAVECHPLRGLHVMRLSDVTARNRGRVRDGEPVDYVVLKVLATSTQAADWRRSFVKDLKAKKEESGE